MKGYYNVSSLGLERNDIFKSNEDFISGMNDIAICITGFEVRILCFCLMSNHFHFLLYGTSDECRRFAYEYKRRCAIRMRLTSGEVQALKEVGIQIDLVDTKEYLENVVAYILRNPLAAGIVIMPYCYKWSSASLYFRGEKPEAGERLDGMSERKRFRILKSRVPVPDHYMVDECGMIMPSSYVDVESVERILHHPSRLMMLLSKRVENEVELKFGVADSVNLTDQEILTQMPFLIRNEFGKDTIEQLSMEQRVRLCLLLKRNFRAGVKQIARITRLEPAIVAKVV